jgi:hypothetical protein
MLRVRLSLILGYIGVGIGDGGSVRAVSPSDSSWISVMRGPLTAGSGVSSDSDEVGTRRISGFGL